MPAINPNPQNAIPTAGVTIGGWGRVTVNIGVGP